MRKLIFIFFFCPFFSYAQDSVKEGIQSRSLILKYSPLSLLDPLSSVQFALEHQIGTKTSLQHELGYITNIFMWTNDDYKDTRGWRLRNEVRFYLQQKGRNLKGMYLAPEFLFINLKYWGSASEGQGCVDFWNCNYYKIIDYPVHKQVFAFHPKFGYQIIVKHLAIDFYAGLGYRHVRVREINKPARSLDIDDFDLFNSRKRTGNYDLPSFSAGFKFGYMF